jgi:hypothetical protein
MIAWCCRAAMVIVLGLIVFSVGAVFFDWIYTFSPTEIHIEHMDLQER